MPKLKLLTLNLHCLVEDDLSEKQRIIAEEITQREVDIIFLQEVAQTRSENILYGDVKTDNYGETLRTLLREKGLTYFYAFEPIKHSFGKYDEGIGILSKAPIKDVFSKYISKCTDYAYWRTRKSLHATINEYNIKVISTHLGWTDEYENFNNQVDNLVKNIGHELTLIAGDFNVSPTTSEYEYILSKGFIDLYGKEKSNLLDPTHVNDIDTHSGAARIDYVFSTHDVLVLDRKILFTKNKVSDHYGVYLEIQF